MTYIEVILYTAVIAALWFSIGYRFGKHSK